MHRESPRDCWLQSIHNGKTILRTKYTAAYPQKFGRTVAKVLVPKLFHQEKPYCDLNSANLYAG